MPKTSVLFQVNYTLVFLLLLSLKINNFIELEGKYYAKTPNLQLHIMVTYEKLALIQERIEEVNSQNQNAFIRKLALDGYALNGNPSPEKNSYPCNVGA